MLTDEQFAKIFQNLPLGPVGSRAIADEAYRLGYDEATKDVERLRKRANNQRTELRRLNKYLGPYWTGFRKGINCEAEVRLRRIMNAAFGHEKVREAEHAAIDRAIKMPE